MHLSVAKLCAALIARRSSISAIPIAILFAMLTPQLVNAQTAAGTITSITGDVQIIRGGNTIKAAQGNQVQVGDRLKTGPGANVAVTLADRSRFELGESAEMAIDQHTVDAAGFGTTRLGLFAGVMRSFVAKTVGARPADYQVHTPNAVGAARGTGFDSAYYPNTSRGLFPGCTQFSDYTVYEDSVDVWNTASPASTVHVNAGYQSTVACLLLPTVPVLTGTTAAVTATNWGAVAAAAGAVGAGGIVGGLAGTGTLSGGSPNTATPKQ